METPGLKQPKGFKKLVAFFFFMKANNNVMLVSILTLFLKTAGAKVLPWVYVLSNLIFIVVQILTLRVPKRDGHAFLLSLSKPLIVSSIFLSFFPIEHSSWACLMCLVLFQMVDIYSTQAFMHLASQILPLREAKKYLPMVFAAGSAGSILSGLGLKLLLDLVDFYRVFLFAGLVMLVSDRLLVSIQEDIQESQPNSDTIQNNPFSSKFPGTAFLAWILLVVSFLNIFNKYLVDYLYINHISSYFESTKDLATFIGVFGASTDLIVIGFQVFLSGWTFSNIPLGLVMSMMPLALVSLCSVAGFFPSLYSIAGTQLVLLICTKSFVNPGIAILMEPLSEGKRTSLRHFTTLASAFGSLASGILLLYITKGGVSPLFFLAVASFYGILLLVNFLIGNSYSRAVRETLDSVKGHGDLEVIRSIRFIPPNDRIIRIRELLQHDDPEVRYRAILEIAEIPPEKASSILKDVIVSEKNPRNLTTAARVVLDLLGPDGLDLIKDLLQSSEDPRLLADMIEAISIAGDQPQVRTLIMRCLSHNNHRVRGNAVLGLLRIANDKESLGDALDVLLNMVFHPDALFRASAAVGMGAMGLPIFIPPLSHLADDQDVNVTRNALNSLGNIRTPAALAAISTRSASGGWRGEIAASIWGFTSRESFEHMVGVLSYLNMADRKSLGVRFQNLGNSDFFALLEKILNLENQEIRERLTRSLKSFDKDKIEMIANCIKPLDSENTIVDIEPLIGELGASDFVVLSPQAELVPILCGRANEKYEQFIDDAVMNLYREGALLEKAKNFGLFKNTSDEATSFDKFEKKIQVSLHLIALGVENPPQILDAFDKAMSSDKFICSVSQEFLEEKLGRLKASLILPLLMGRRLLSEIAQITEKHFGIKFSDGEKEAVSALMKEKGYFL